MSACGTESPPPQQGVIPTQEQEQPESTYMGSLVYDDHLDLARSQSLNRDWTFPTAPTTEPIARAPPPVGPMDIPRDTQHTPAEAAEIAVYRRRRQLGDVDTESGHISAREYGATSMTRALGRRPSPSAGSTVGIHTVLSHAPGNGTNHRYRRLSHDQAPASAPHLPPFAMSPEPDLSPVRGRDRAPVSLSAMKDMAPAQTQWPSSNLLPLAGPDLEFDDPFFQSPTPSIIYGPASEASDTLPRDPPAGTTVMHSAEIEVPTASEPQLQPLAMIPSPGPFRPRVRGEWSPPDPFVSSPSPSSSVESVDENHYPAQVHMTTLAALTGNGDPSSLGRPLSFDPIQLLEGAEHAEAGFSTRDGAVQTGTQAIGAEEHADEDGSADASPGSPFVPIDFSVPPDCSAESHIHAQNIPPYDEVAELEERPESLDDDAMPEDRHVSIDLEAMLEDLSQFGRSALAEQTISENEVWDATASTIDFHRATQHQTTEDATTPAMSHAMHFPALAPAPSTDPSALLSPDSANADSPFPHTPGPTNSPIDFVTRKETWKQYSCQFGGPLSGGEPSEGDERRAPADADPTQ